MWGELAAGWPAKILGRLSSDLPITIEIGPPVHAPTPRQIESFLEFADEAIGDGLATVERVEIRIHRSEGPDA